MLNLLCLSRRRRRQDQEKRQSERRKQKPNPNPKTNKDKDQDQLRQRILTLQAGYCFVFFSMSLSFISFLAIEYACGWLLWRGSNHLLVCMALLCPGAIAAPLSLPPPLPPRVPEKNNVDCLFDAAVCCDKKACLLLWHVKLLLPLKLFTVFLHELSHAIAAWLTGATVTGIEVDYKGCIECYFRAVCVWRLGGNFRWWWPKALTLDNQGPRKPRRTNYLPEHAYELRSKICHTCRYIMGILLLRLNCR